MRGKLVLCALLLVVTSYAGASLQARPAERTSGAHTEMTEDLHDLYSEQIMDMQRALDLLRLQLQLGDELIDSQAAQIQGLENSLESVKRLADARVASEKARCPRCMKPWLNWTTRGLAFAVGGYAGRGSCDFGN